MAESTPVPRFAANLAAWWEDLLGPGLGAVWAGVQRASGDPKVLRDTYGATVASFEKALDDSAVAVLDLQQAAASAGPEWQAVATNAAIAYTRMNDRWVDPEATRPVGAAAGNTAGPLGFGGPVTQVIQTARRVVTAVGIAWAAASLVHALALGRWARKQAARARAGQSAPRLRTR